MNCDVERSPYKHKAAIVIAEKLDDKSQAGVKGQIFQDDLPGEVFFGKAPHQKQQTGRSAPTRFVDLGRVERDIERDADIVIGILIGEGDSPRQRGRLAVAAAGRQASEAADGLSQGDSGRGEIGHRPARAASFLQIPGRGSQCQQQAAVINPGGTKRRERKDLPEVLGVILEIREKQNDLCAHQGGKNNDQAPGSRLNPD